MWKDVKESGRASCMLFALPASLAGGQLVHAHLSTCWMIVRLPACLPALTAETQQAWVLAGSRSSIVSAAAEQLLARWGWAQLRLSKAQLDDGSSEHQPGTVSNSTLQQVQQLSQVAQLLPKLVALLHAHDKQRHHPSSSSSSSSSYWQMRRHWLGCSSWSLT